MALEADVRGVGVSVDEDGRAHAVVLEVDDEIVPIYVSPEQAHSTQLALRLDCPVRVDETVLSRAGRPASEFEVADSGDREDTDDRHR